MTDEVTGIFTTARPMLSHRPLMGTLGNRRYRLFGMATKCPSTTDSSAERAGQRRNSSPLFHRAKYSISSPPASVEPRESRQTVLRKLSRGAVDAPPIANPRGSLCHRCPAHRLVPSGRPRALGHARRCASPEIRVSRSGHGRDVRTGRAVGNKKPSGAAGSGGSVRSGLSILQSGKIAPMSRACAVDWPEAIRQSPKSFVAVLHHWVHAFTNGSVREGAGHTPATCGCQARRM